MNEVEPETCQSNATEAEPDYTWPFGVKHKRSRRIIGAFILIAVLAPLIWFGFAPEIAAIHWHWKHGDTFTYEGVMFQIPRDHFVECWPGGSCNVMYAVGYFRWRTSKPPFHWITLNHVTNVGLGKFREMDRMRAERFHWKLLPDRQIVMAGSDLRCTEYLENNKLHKISCYAPGTSILATYIGGDDPERFYTLLSTARVP